VPACKPESQRNSEIAARALVLVGQIAVENHSLFSPALLKDVSNSITCYLHDANSPYRLLAVDLCSSGFQIWQHYIDAMEILRSLFQLAMQKTLPTALAARARTATLQIASSNTPLFMTTLSYDILNANSPAQRNATMKLVAFMAKRRPLVLYASLARIAEAIVKSLDPNASAARDAVQQTATVILESLVST
jgi:WD repeat-containing protein 7